MGAATDSYAYGATSNRIASVTPASGPVRNFAFDANGSTTSDAVNQYAYDTRGRMVQALSAVGSSSYQVNALGQRVRKANTLGESVFHYDAQGRLLAETDAAGALKREIVYLGDMPVLAAAMAQGQGGGECAASAPRTDPGTGFVPFGTLERLEVRSGRLGAADWEWGLGVNTQQAGQFATANLDWVNERLYDWTLSYSGTGAATLEVRDAGAVLFTRSWASGMDAGNALKLYVKSSAGIPAGTRITATSATLNGQPAAGSLQSAGTGEFSEASLFWFYPAMSQGFTATGTVKLTFSGSYPPTGSRLNFIVTAGTLPCAPPPAQAKLYYIHVDHLNTPRLIADEQQRTVWRWDNTDPFGGNAPDENPSGLGTFEFPLRHSNYYFDKETNQHYAMYRDCYDSATGRFCQFDPIGLRGGINGFAFVDNNPLSFIDPLGLCKCRAVDKDYDPNRGFYIDKFSFLPYPNISGRFACIYFCEDNGKGDRVEGYIHDERYFGFSGGGPSAAQRFICRNSIRQFIPKRNLMGQITYYDTVPFGDFDPRGSGIGGLEDWAKKNCKDC